MSPGSSDIAPAAALHSLLGELYGERASAMVEDLVGTAAGPSGEPNAGRWSENDAWLITYADQFRSPGEQPLATLHRVFRRDLEPALNGVHVLPCYPWTSDDGYAVKDYLRIDPEYGTWDDIARLAGDARLMLDAVINHTSASCPWFVGFLEGDARYTDFYRTADPDADLSATVRPRSSPLLTPFEAVDGRRWVWTTFSADQVDLDFRNPDVFLTVARVLGEYARRGAGMIRLDAVQFLGKREGTSSINLPEAHTIVRALRAALDLEHPGVVLVSESNVPHHENLAYLGNPAAPEAQVVYQFALAPLVLHTMVTGDTSALTEWLAGLEPLHPSTTVLNYLASHDGVALRPVEGILAASDVDRLVDHTRAAGGRINERSLASGEAAPYELACTWFDLMAHGFDEGQARARHLASHAIMLALQGIPAIYVHSLFGTSNDHELAQRTGMARSLNRHKFDLADLEKLLGEPNGRAGSLLDGLRSMLGVRRTNPAFHPAAPQDVLATPPGLVGIRRGETTVFVNVTTEPQPLPDAGGRVTYGTVDSGTVAPFESVWAVSSE